MHFASKTARPFAASPALAGNASADTVWAASDDDVELGWEEAALPLIRRFIVARRDTERLRRMLWAQRRLAKGRTTRSASLERQPWFHEAVMLLRIGARSHEGLADAARAWNRRARDVPRRPEPRPVRRPRRRRRP